MSSQMSSNNSTYFSSLSLQWDQAIFVGADCQDVCPHAVKHVSWWINDIKTQKRKQLHPNWSVTLLSAVRNHDTNNEQVLFLKNSSSQNHVSQSVACACTLESICSMMGASPLTGTWCSCHSGFPWSPSGRACPSCCVAFPAGDPHQPPSHQHQSQNPCSAVPTIKVYQWFRNISHYMFMCQLRPTNAYQESTERHNHWEQQNVGRHYVWAICCHGQSTCKPTTFPRHLGKGHVLI